jgi:hypothetical protein
VKADASLNGDGVGSMTRVELEAVDGELGVPKGKQRRLLVGRWFKLSQSRDRLSVAHAMIAITLNSSNYTHLKYLQIEMDDILIIGKTRIN